MHQYFIYCRKSTTDDYHQALSLESQRRELVRYAEAHSLPVAEVLFEEKSARAPGQRPVYTRMLQRISRGEADGIIAWQPDRLSRNAVEGGEVIHLLDIGKLNDLRFPTVTFENSPSGKFMLMIMFGQSKFEVDTMSERIRRGNRTKRELGWLPGRPPIGYMNIRSDSGASIIGRDPERFPIVKQLWTLFLTGEYSGLDILSLAGSRLRLRTKHSWRRGGGPLGQATLYRLLRNPFYAGYLIKEGQWLPGSHEPMISVEEFNRAQGLLRRRTRARPHQYRFPYTGLIRCGHCRCSITAERRVKPSGRSYVYYHCTHGKSDIPCGQKAITEAELERQIIARFAPLYQGGTLLTNPEGLRLLLATRAESVTLADKMLTITLKEPR